MKDLQDIRQACSIRQVSPSELVKRVNVSEEYTENLKKLKKSNEYDILLNGAKKGLTAYLKAETGIPEEDLSLELKNLLSAIRIYMELPSETSKVFGQVRYNPIDKTLCFYSPDDTECLNPLGIVDTTRLIKGLKFGKFYILPQTGIPEQDLSIYVLDSLAKAKTAVQDTNYVHTDNNYSSEEKLKLRTLEENVVRLNNTAILTEEDPTVPQWAKQPSKPSYTAGEVGALPDTTKIPSKTSDLENDSGFLTQHQDVSGKADKSDTYTKVQVDTMVADAGKVKTANVNGTTGDMIQTLDVNKFYMFGEVDSLTLTLNAPTACADGTIPLAMYAGKFTASTDWGGVGLSITANVTEAPNNDLVTAGKVYEFNILDNIIVVKEVG